ncbi:hypothetical protein ACFLU4_01535 [Chloroflexota bacterium]
MRKVIGTLQTFGAETTPAPAVQVYVYIERIRHGEWVDFLIDTGASASCLHGAYALDLQNRMRIRSLRYYGGIAGMSSGYYHEEAELLFLDDKGNPFSRFIRIGIQQFTREHLADPDILEECLDCPSLLGRDILNRCLFAYSIAPEEVTLTFHR